MAVICYRHNPPVQATPAYYPFTMPPELSNYLRSTYPCQQKYKLVISSAMNILA